MKSLALKREEIVKDIRRKCREQIRSNIRNSMLAKMNSNQCPLISNIFGDFVHFTHWQLCQESERLCQVIETAHLTDLDDDQHEEFITDLYYLIHENIITLPFQAVFKKNQSGYTAALVALCANSIDEDELAYWVEYMNDEAKDVMFYGITVEDETHQKWITNPLLYQFLLDNIKFMESAAITFNDFLMLSQEITKKQVDQCIPYVQSAIKYSMEKENISFTRITTQTWIKLIQIYSKLEYYNEKVKEMIASLKQIINANVNILMSSNIINELNTLYEMIREDYIQDNMGCQILLMNYLRSKETNEEYEYSLENEELFKNYLFRLIHNNWRAKQLKNRQFQYTPDFYELLQRVNNGSQSNPFYSKLMNIKANMKE